MGGHHRPRAARGDHVPRRTACGHPHRALSIPAVNAARVRVFPGTYRDSLLLLSATRAMHEADGIGWAAAVMATPANVADLAGHGVSVSGADANALVLAVQAADGQAADEALDRGRALLFAAEGANEDPGQAEPQTIGEAAARLPDANVAVVSVPGPYAALSALTAGLHVLLFSDNVPLADEIALKDRASGLGKLVMGPGAGTAVLGGVGLGFANAVRAGSVGVVAAAGTGAQEVMTLLDRWGIGVSHVVGVGGRDLSAQVGGRLAGAPLAVTLEDGAVAVARTLGMPVPDLTEGLAGAAQQAVGRLAAARTAVRGFYTGGTLCYEAQVVLTALPGPVHSNIPLRPDLGLPVPDRAHVCLDLGEEEYSQGRPHPMIDPAARRDIMREQAFGDDVAAVLLDVVLGYGSHPDPAGELAGTCADIVASGATAVCYVLGARADPQGLDRQRAVLQDAGAIVTESAAQAARVAAAIAARRLSPVRP